MLPSLPQQNITQDIVNKILDFKIVQEKVSQENLNIYFEVCQNCSLHLTSTRHNEKVYKELYQNICQMIKKEFPNSNITKNSDKLIASENKVYPRLGAFEIALDNKSIYSKLKTGMFPQPNYVLEKLKKLATNNYLGRKCSSPIPHNNKQKLNYKIKKLIPHNRYFLSTDKNFWANNRRHEFYGKSQQLQISYISPKGLAISFLNSTVQQPINYQNYGKNQICNLSFHQNTYNNRQYQQEFDKLNSSTISYKNNDKKFQDTLLIQKLEVNKTVEDEKKQQLLYQE